MPPGWPSNPATRDLRERSVGPESSPWRGRPECAAGTARHSLKARTDPDPKGPSGWIQSPPARGDSPHIEQDVPARPGALQVTILVRQKGSGDPASHHSYS